MYYILAIALVLGTAAAAPYENYGHISAIDHYSIPRYEFNYAVNDPVTGDNKAQSEVREGDVVKGSYSLVESDGTVRLVEYTADDIRGFNANVKRIGAAAHPQKLFTPVVKQVVPSIPAPVYEPISKPIYRPIAPPVYSNIIAPINYGYSVSKNLQNFGGYDGYEKGLGLGLELGYGGWNLGRLGLGHGGW